jgi:hypothetical protein
MTMTEFDRDFLVLDYLPTPSLEEDIDRRLGAVDVSAIAILERPRSKELRQRPRRRRVAAAVLVSSALLLAGAAYAITRPPASATVEGIVCFEDARGESGGNVVGADGRSPAVVCAEMWEAGSILPNVSLAPPLQACTFTKGHYVGVFPSDDPNLCASLGLAPAPAAYKEAAAQFAGMRDDLASRLGTCVSVDEAGRTAREVLDRHGFVEWTIESIGAASPKTPCSDYSLDAVGQLLRLYAEPTDEG